MIKKVRLSESVVDALKQMISDGKFAPGDKFYSEKELTEKLQVSRSSVREAVRMLEATGQVTVRHGKGTFIADTAPQPFEGFKEWLKTNEQTIQDLFEVRLMIEPKTAWYAARRASAKDIKALEESYGNFVRYAKVDDTAQTIEHDRKFHKLLARAAGNKTLHALMRSISSSMLDGWISSFHTPGRMEKTVSEHDEILQAIKRQDPEAAKKAMEAHLGNAIKDILASMEKK